jgi:hypothetical protein
MRLERRHRVVAKTREHQVEAARVLVCRDRDRILDVHSRDHRRLGERGVGNASAISKTKIVKN